MATRPISVDDPFAEPEISEEEARQRMLEAGGNIVSRLAVMANDCVRKRLLIEQGWQDAIRAYQGKYDAEIEKMLKDAQINGSARSRAFVKICKSKTDSWEARLSDLLFPADDKNYGINPTPVPELTDSAQQAVDEATRLEAEAEAQVEAANQQNSNGTSPDEALSEATRLGEAAQAFKAEYAKAQKTMDEAKRRSELMAREIDDQLTECTYPKRCRDVIRDACRLGVGVMKGPVVANRTRQKWAQEEGTNIFRLQKDPDPRPECRRVDPWHFFPDPNATSIDDMEYTFERYLPTRRDLRNMARNLGFDPEGVRQVLNDGAGYGLASELKYLDDLRAIGDEGEALQGRYVMWEYNGPLECDEIATLLAAAGRHEESKAFSERNDPLEEHMVTVFFCNGIMLKIAEHYLLDSGETLYSVFSFSPGEASIMGARGVPSLMLDTLKALNAAWRMMLDNAAMSALPQVAVDKTQMTPEDGNWKLTPGKVWVRIGQAIPNAPKPFEVFNLPINQAQIAGIIELALKFIDEETSLPMIAQGEQGQHVTQTMGGMTMLFNSANVVFRRVVKNWDDDMTTPMIRRLYHWNMQFSKKETIKGDMQVEARGTSVLLVREVQSQNLMVIATTWTNHPVLGAAVKAYGVLRMAIQSLGINPDDVLESEDDFVKNMKAMQENSAQNPDVIRAQATIEAANITAKSREADGQVQLQIASIRRETELIKLAEASNMSVEELKAKLAMKQIETDSKERLFAAEVGAQAQARSEAAQLGQQPPKGGGGSV